MLLTVVPLTVDLHGLDLLRLRSENQVVAAGINRHRAVGLRDDVDVDQVRELRQVFASLVGQTDGRAAWPIAPLGLRDLRVEAADLLDELIDRSRRCWPPADRDCRSS